MRTFWVVLLSFVSFGLGAFAAILYIVSKLSKALEETTGRRLDPAISVKAKAKPKTISVGR